MKSLRIVFFGTPEFAAQSLDAINQSEHQVVGVVTVADKASGRGQKIHESPVKKYATAHQLPVFQPDKLRNTAFLNEMRALNADVFVVVAFRMMPKVLFEIPKLGTFNLHASLLPDYRGAAPINYAVINGETSTGATTFFINEKIDEGNILLQEKLDIDPEENAGSLHDRLMVMGSQLVVKTLNELANGTIKQQPQPYSENPKNAFKIFKEDTRIDWSKDLISVHNFIRGMSPYPCAFTTLDVENENRGFKIYEGTYEKTSHNKTPGTVFFTKNTMEVYVEGGIYYPTEVQLEGKKRMNIKDFINGFQNLEKIKIAQ